MPTCKCDLKEEDAHDSDTPLAVIRQSAKGGSVEYQQDKTREEKMKEDGTEPQPGILAGKGRRRCRHGTRVISTIATIFISATSPRDSNEVTSGYKYNILAGYPASLGFPPSLPPSLCPLKLTLPGGWGLRV